MKSLTKFFRVLVVYASFVFRAFSFFLIAPFLTDKFDAFSWGNIISSQALAAWLVLLLDFGFTLSLSRKLAVDRDKKHLANVYVGEVITAKFILFLPALLITLVCSHILVDNSLIWLGLALAVSQGFSPLWYYQAIEKLEMFSLVDIVVRIIYIGLILIFIRNSQDGYLVLLIQISTNLISTLITLYWMFRDIGLPKMNFKGGVNALREGISLSGFTLITSIYTSASVVVYGFFAQPADVAIYGNADRLLRTGISLIGPMNQMLSPKSTRYFSESEFSGRRFFRKVFILYLVLGILIGVVLWLSAPFIINLFFGKKYDQSVQYFRDLLILFPLTAINTVIVYHYLIPNGRENLMIKIYMSVSFVSAVMIFILTPLFGGIGMIYSMVAPEFLASLILIRVIYIEKVLIKRFPVFNDA